MRTHALLGTYAHFLWNLHFFFNYLMIGVIFRLFLNWFPYLKMRFGAKSGDGCHFRVIFSGEYLKMQYIGKSVRVHKHFWALMRILYETYTFSSGSCCWVSFLGNFRWSIYSQAEGGGRNALVYCPLNFFCGFPNLH